MTRTYSRRDLVWRDREVYRRGGRTPLASITYDEAWPLWRVRMPDGSLSDLLNITWASDAAVTIALAQLNREAAPGIAPDGGEAGLPSPAENASAVAPRHLAHPSGEDRR